MISIAGAYVLGQVTALAAIYIGILLADAARD